MIWNEWYQCLWQQPTFWGDSRGSCSPLSHAAVISTVQRLQKCNHQHQQQWRNHFKLYARSISHCAVENHKAWLFRRCGILQGRWWHMVNNVPQSSRKARLKTTRELTIFTTTPPFLIQNLITLFQECSYYSCRKEAQTESNTSNRTVLSLLQRAHINPGRPYHVPRNFQPASVICVCVFLYSLKCLDLVISHR